MRGLRSSANPMSDAALSAGGYGKAQLSSLGETIARVETGRDHWAEMTGRRIVALVGVLVAVVVGSADASTRGRLPAPLAADCGSGVAGIGFTAYACTDGGGGTKYAHPSELLVLRADGSYRGYRNSISEPNLMARSTNGGVVAAHNESIVQVTASALRTLISQGRLDQLLPRSPGLVAINAVSVRSSGAVLFCANYYAPHRHGCVNIRAELTADGQLRVLSRSATGLICG